MKASLLQLRPYSPADYPKLCEWCEFHERRPPPEASLPPLGLCVFSTDGFVNDNLIFVFLYLAQGVGVCFLEHLVSRPGMTAGQARRATVVACDHFKRLAGSMGYRLMVAHTLRGIARLMIHEGWKQSDAKVPLMAMFIGLEAAA